MNVRRFLILVALLARSPISIVGAQEPRLFCRPDLTPAPAGECFPDELKIVFVDEAGRLQGSERRVRAGDEVCVAVVMDVVSPQVQACVYGVRHDPRILEFVSMTTAGADFESYTRDDSVNRFGPGFDDTIPEQGFVHAVLLSIAEPAYFPIEQDVTLSFVKFRVLATPPPAEPSLLRFVDAELSLDLGEFRFEVRIVETGESRRPRRVTDAKLVGLVDCNANEVPDDEDLASGGSRDLNENLVPDECEGRFFHRGDANADGKLDIADGVCALLYLFEGTYEPPCKNAADANDDGAIDCSDAVVVVRYLYLGEAAPPEPGPPSFRCGPDPGLPTEREDLGCDVYEPCSGPAAGG